MSSREYDGKSGASGSSGCAKRMTIFALLIFALSLPKVETVRPMSELGSGSTRVAAGEKTFGWTLVTVAVRHVRQWNGLALQFDVVVVVVRLCSVGGCTVEDLSGYPWQVCAWLRAREVWRSRCLLQPPRF